VKNSKHQQKSYMLGVTEDEWPMFESNHPKAPQYPTVNTIYKKPDAGYFKEGLDHLLSPYTKPPVNPQHISNLNEAYPNASKTYQSDANPEPYNGYSQMMGDWWFVSKTVRRVKQLVESGGSRSIHMFKFAYRVNTGKGDLLCKCIYLYRLS
jgi:hypothetical protein